MRYPASEKLGIIRLVEQSRLPVRQTLEKLAILPARFYRWYDRYQDTRHTRHRSPAHRPVNRMDVAKRRWLFSCDRSLANTHVCLPLPFQPHGTRSPIPLPVFGHTHLSRMIENHSERESIRAFFSSIDSSSVSSGPIECSFLSFSPKTLEAVSKGVEWPVSM